MKLLKSMEELCTSYNIPQKDGFQEDVYFDDETGLIRKTYKVIQTSIDQAEMIQSFDDYRRVNGIQLPFRVESQYPPNEVDLNIINQLEINQRMHTYTDQYAAV